jgi:hypothetical protein
MDVGGSMVLFQPVQLGPVLARAAGAESSATALAATAGIAIASASSVIARMRGTLPP